MDLFTGRIVMQSFQLAAEETKRRGQRQVSTAIGVAGTMGGLAATRLFSKALPLLNQYLPANLAIKGLNKIDKRLGNFVKNATSEGFTEDEALNFMRQEANDSIKKSAESITQEFVNESPDLDPEFNFLKKKNLIPKINTMIKGGKSRGQIIDFLKKKLPMLAQEQLRFMGAEENLSIDEKLNQMLDKFFTPQQETQETVVQESIQQPQRS